jgi:hypothetical protein
VSITAAREIEDYTAEVYEVDHVQKEVNELEKLVVWVGRNRLERQEAGVGANVVRRGRGETEGETKGTERGGAVEATNCKRGERKSKGEAA